MKNDKESLQKCTQNLIDSIIGKSYNGLDQMLQVIEENENKDDSFLFDRFTKIDWKYINMNCHLIPFQEIQKVNYECEQVPYIYAGYVKPGRHVIIIYKPDEKTYY